MFDYEINKHINNLETRWKNILCDEVLNTIKNKNVLDLGSFDGYGPNIMKSLGAKNVLAVEVNPELSTKIIENYKDIDVLNSDVETLDFKNIEYKTDVVTCLGLIYFLNDYDTFLKNIHGIDTLKYIIIENIDTELTEKFKVVRFINNDNLMASIKNAGFEILFVKNFKVNEFANKNMSNRVLIIAKK